MKTKRPFVKVIASNEVVKHHLSNQTLILEDFLTHFRVFNIHINEWAQLSIIDMPLKWHHIEICNKNCKNVDMLTRMLARLFNLRAQLETFIPLQNK
jgi:hypothetical protein